MHEPRTRDAGRQTIQDVVRADAPQPGTWPGIPATRSECRPSRSHRHGCRRRPQTVDPKSRWRRALPRRAGSQKASLLHAGPTSSSPPYQLARHRWTSAIGPTLPSRRADVEMTGFGALSRRMSTFRQKYGTRAMANKSIMARTGFPLPRPTSPATMATTAPCNGAMKEMRGATGRRSDKSTNNEGITPPTAWAPREAMVHGRRHTCIEKSG